MPALPLILQTWAHSLLTQARPPHDRQDEQEVRLNASSCSVLPSLLLPCRCKPLQHKVPDLQEQHGSFTCSQSLSSDHSP